MTLLIYQYKQLKLLTNLIGQKFLTNLQSPKAILILYLYQLLSNKANKATDVLSCYIKKSLEKIF